MVKAVVVTAGASRWSAGGLSGQQARGRMATRGMHGQQAPPANFFKNISKKIRIFGAFLD